MQDLISDVKLNDCLRQQGEDDRKARERRGWDAVHWRYGTGSTDDERDIRWRVDEAMTLLDEMATTADVEFTETHGDQKRGRDNPTRSAVRRAIHNARPRHRRTAHDSDE